MNTSAAVAPTQWYEIEVPEDRLMTLVAGIHSSNPELTLREIAGQLERLHERTPRGGTKWSPSSVKNLIDRAKRTGLLEAV